MWFHPEYKLSEVGYQSGGHAPPLSELKGLMSGYTEKVRLEGGKAADAPPTSELSTSTVIF